MKERVYNIKDIRRPPDCTYIGRAGHGLAGPYGNPYRVSEYGRGTAVEQYEFKVKSDKWLRDKLREELTGKNLVCFCAPINGKGVGPDDPLTCHGQIILRAIRGDYEHH